MFIRLKNQTAT